MFKEASRSQVFFNKKIEVRTSSLHGLGIFATESIEKHECIESAPVVLFHQDTMHELRKNNIRNETHILHDYVFGWERQQVAIGLGYASLYNHANHDANVSYRMLCNEPGRIEFIAKRKIEAGEELLVHYRLGRGAVQFDISGGKI